MGCCRHLTRDGREEIAVLRAAGQSMRTAAAAIGKAASTIGRELGRNALDSGRHSAHVAGGAYMARRQRPALPERGRRLAGAARGGDGDDPCLHLPRRPGGGAALALPCPPPQAPAQTCGPAVP